MKKPKTKIKGRVTKMLWNSGTAKTPINLIRGRTYSKSRDGYL